MKNARYVGTLVNYDNKPTGIPLVNVLRRFQLNRTLWKAWVKGCMRLAHYLRHDKDLPWIGMNKVQAAMLWYIEKKESERWLLEPQPMTYDMWLERVLNIVDTPAEETVDFDEGLIAIKLLHGRMKQCGTWLNQLKKVQPLNWPDVFKEVSKPTSPGTFLGGTKTDWSALFAETDDINADMIKGSCTWKHWLSYADFFGASVSYRYEYGQKVRAIINTDLSRALLQMKAANPLIRWWNSGPISYSASPEVLNKSIRDLTFCQNPYSHSVMLDFKNYGPDSSYGFWFLALMYILPLVGLKMRKELMTAFKHYIPVTLWIPSADGLRMNGVMPLQHGAVTGQPLHNFLGNIAMALVAVLSAHYAGVQDYAIRGSLDDIAMFVHTKEERRRVLAGFYKATRALGASPQTDKTLTGTQCAYMQKSVWGGRYPYKSGARWLGTKIIREFPPPFGDSSPLWILLAMAATGRALPPFFSDIWWWLREKYSAKFSSYWDELEDEEQRKAMDWWLTKQAHGVNYLDFTTPMRLFPPLVDQELKELDSYHEENLKKWFTKKFEDWEDWPDYVTITTPMKDFSSITYI